MTLDAVPADVVLEMTTELQRLFRVARCNPACHCCGVLLPVGSSFILATVDNIDEMLGTCCTKEQLAAKREAQREKLAAKKAQEAREYARYKAQHPGYSRPTLKATTT